jgi:hypothetical protein
MSRTQPKPLPGDKGTQPNPMVETCQREEAKLLARIALEAPRAVNANEAVNVPETEYLSFQHASQNPIVPLHVCGCVSISHLHGADPDSYVTFPGLPTSLCRRSNTQMCDDLSHLGEMR